MQPDTQPRRDYLVAFSVVSWRRGFMPLMAGGDQHPEEQGLKPDIGAHARAATGGR